MTIESDLEANTDEFIESADEDVAKGRYNSAVTSYFKAIATICDLKIYEWRRVLPKNHSERFSFLKEGFYEIYKIIGPLFKKYIKTYNLRLGKEEAITFKKNVEEIKKRFEKKT